MNIIQKPSPNFDDRAGQKPSIILLHYTGMKTAEDALARLTSEDSKVSSHYTVDEDGTIYNHVSESKRAWHAGQSYWRGERNINAISIGIEVVNPGHEFGYRKFPVVQIQAVQTLCKDIIKRHEINDVLAHSDVAPDRKQDPGELFPWKELAQNGVGEWPEPSDEDMVKGAGLNVPRALQDMGYEAFNKDNILIAFQRHYVPEAFKKGTEGHACGLTKGRLYALLARHLISTT
ncbi:MAG: N-acetylmuramoyl-L-alanine amidase [Alphaproteobacteria bacterium]|nr:N-acetylmuramoyl-L-alanine amidase [Alphaproteobacteria bacterium]